MQIEVLRLDSLSLKPGVPPLLALHQSLGCWWITSSLRVAQCHGCRRQFLARTGSIRIGPTAPLARNQVLRCRSSVAIGQTDGLTSGCACRVHFAATTHFWASSPQCRDVMSMGGYRSNMSHTALILATGARFSRLRQRHLSE